jgi:hypothetical protein
MRRWAVVAFAAAIGDWSEFFVAQVGVAAVLAGLVFVGVSINLEQVMSMPSLPERALEAMVALATVLVEGSLLLVPGQSPRRVGAEVLAVGVVAWGITTGVHRDIANKLEDRYKRVFVPTIVLGQLAVLSFVVGGAVLLADGDSGGVYWLVPGVVLSYLVAISEAWVLLVEIHR